MKCSLFGFWIRQNENTSKGKEKEKEGEKENEMELRRGKKRGTWWKETQVIGEDSCKSCKDEEMNS